jgi:heat shock protein HslJ
MFKYFFAILFALATQKCDDNKTENLNTVSQKNDENMTETPIQLHDIWALTHIKEEAIALDKYPNGVPVLEIFIEEKKVGGFSGCNNYFASIEKLNDKEFKLGMIGATKMYCMGVDEYVYFENIQKVTHFKIEKMQLFLFENEQLLLTFKKVD